MTDKMKVPAAVVWDTKKELLPLEVNWLYVMQLCQEGLTDNKKYVILPVEESQDYKPQRRRLVKADKSCPRGLIQRDPKAKQIYYPYAAARFDIVELGKYAAEKFNTFSSEDLQRMANEITAGNNR